MKNPEPELTRIRVDLPNHWWHKEELLWARPLGGDTYEIAKMPFCAYGLNCGDVVLATPDAPDLKPEVRSVLRRSGNRTLRMSFGSPAVERGAAARHLGTWNPWELSWSVSPYSLSASTSLRLPTFRLFATT